eukprot:5789422-Amphidinium_carterae.1
MTVTQLGTEASSPSWHQHIFHCTMLVYVCVCVCAVARLSRWVGSGQLFKNSSLASYPLPGLNSLARAGDPAAAAAFGRSREQAWRQDQTESKDASRARFNEAPSIRVTLALYMMCESAAQKTQNGKRPQQTCQEKDVSHALFFGYVLTTEANTCWRQQHHSPLPDPSHRMKNRPP